MVIYNFDETHRAEDDNDNVTNNVLLFPLLVDTMIFSSTLVKVQKLDYKKMNWRFSSIVPLETQLNNKYLWDGGSSLVISSAAIVSTKILEDLDACSIFS